MAPLTPRVRRLCCDPQLSVAISFFQVAQLHTCSQSRISQFDQKHKRNSTELQIIQITSSSDNQSIMKVAVVLFILSVYYIASTEQAANPRSWEEMERRAQQGIKKFKMNGGAAFSQRAKAAQVTIPTDSQELYECVNQDCATSENN